MQIRKIFAVPFVTTLVVSMTGIGLMPAHAANNGDPGVDQQGTIKISSVDDAPDPSNDPHPSCPFRVDFFGLKAGTYDLTFTGWAPTGGGTLLTDTITIAETQNGNTLQASRTYDLGDELAGITPHPQQGYHVRLDAERQGTPGNASKTKVFWVTCAANSGGGVTPPGGGGGGGVTPPGGGGTTVGGTRTTPRVEVLGKTITRSSNTQVLGKSLAMTGVPTAPLVSIAGLFLLLGMLLLRKGQAERYTG